MDSDGSNIRRITDKPSDFCHLEWSLNNTQLAYTEMCAPVDEGMRRVYVVTLEPYNLPKQVTQLTTNGELGEWLPNSEWLEWSTHDPEPERRLSRIDADGKVVDEISLDYDGVWSPDSDRLVWITATAGVWASDSNKLVWIPGETVINVWSRERDEVTTAQLTGVQGGEPIKWLPDGQRLVFGGYSIDTQGKVVDESNWFVVNIDGTGLVEYREP